MQLFERDFGDTHIVAFGEVMDLEGAPALVAEMNGDMAGALAYRSINSALHIIALATDPMWQRSGVGGYLLAEAELLARRLSLKRLAVSTTNDNLPALYFYQRHGYRLSEAVPNGVTKYVPEHEGFGGIPVRDEIRLEKQLT
jgi:GNAT superfamily N-acetyltransferase